MAMFPGIVYWLSVPFLPRFVMIKGIDNMWVGIFMSTFATSYMLSSAITGKYLLKHISRINCILLAAFLTIINLIGVGLLKYFHHGLKIKALGVLFFSCGGFGKGMNVTSSLAIVSSFKKDR